MTSRLRRAAAALVALAAVATSGCAAGRSVAAEATPADKIEQLPAELLPGEMLGLRVAREDMAEQLDNVRRSYTDGVGLYSFRTGELLQATLQITRFNEEADVDSAGFRSQILRDIGGTVPQPISVGRETVYLTRGTKQSLSVWFRGRHLFVLAVREDFLQPRTLLRHALEIEP